MSDQVRLDDLEISVDNLLAELRMLRKGDGATVTRLRSTRVLLSLNQVRQLTERALADELAVAAYKVLRSAVLANGQQPKVVIAGRALGIGVERTGNLTVRRSTSIGQGYALSTVREHEDQGLELLAFALLEGHHQEANLPKADTNELEANYELDEVDVHYLFGPHRQPIKWIDRRVIRSNIDGLRDMLIKHLYSGTAQVHIEVLGGGAIDDRFEAIDSITGFRTQRVVFDRPLRIGEFHGLEVLKRIEGHTTPPAPFLLFVPEQPTGRCRVSVEFNDELPEDGPWATRCFAHSMPQPIGRVSRVQIAARAAAADFTKLVPGYGYGLTWRWPAQANRQGMASER